VPTWLITHRRGRPQPGATCPTCRQRVLDARQQAAAAALWALLAEWEGEPALHDTKAEAEEGAPSIWERFRSYFERFKAWLRKNLYPAT
jgi:hypothetical protein